MRQGLTCAIQLIGGQYSSVFHFESNQIVGLS